MQTENKVLSLHIKKLKGLEGLDISFTDKNITAIMGENGCGKSTILHALACLYKGEDPNSETNYFTRFFKRINRSGWTGSYMTADFQINDSRKTVVYEKAEDRWKPRLEKRPKRNTYYIGIDSCVPSVEKESKSKTSFSMLAGLPINNKENIQADASYILGRSYDDYVQTTCGKKGYRKVNIHDGTQYTSLSMGAGEQRIFYILERLYSVPDYSLILIDELDLTMHTLALKKLVERMVTIADQKHLQIIFTTHREDVASYPNINIRHIWKPANQNKSLCLDHTTPMCMYRLNGAIDKPFEVYVEDDLAEAIVNSVLRDYDILDYVKIIKFGDACNAFSVAAGLQIQNQLTEDQLILIDGDIYRTDEEKMKIMKKRFSGNENGKDEIRARARSHIKQFNLPVGEHPEHYIWTMLKEKEGKFAEFANRIPHNNNDQHHYIYDIYELQGEARPIFLKQLIEVVKSDAHWNEYISEVTLWAKRCKERTGE